MCGDVSQLPAEILVSIVCLARRNIADVISWRLISVSFRSACTEVLHHQTEALCCNEPALLHFNKSNHESIGPVPLGSSILKAVMRLCPSLHRIEWQPVGHDLTRPVAPSLCALMVSRCLHLTHLSLTHCKIPQLALSHLGHLTALQVLSLQHSLLIAILPEPWQAFPQLHCLDLSWFGGLISNHLSLLGPQLLSLSVHGCEFVEESLCKHLWNCIALDICGTGVNDDGLRTLAEVALDLRHLFVSPTYANLWGDPAWTDGMMEEICRRRPEVAVRKLTTPLATSKYEDLGTEDSASLRRGPT